MQVGVDTRLKPKNDTHPSNHCQQEAIKHCEYKKQLVVVCKREYLVKSMFVRGGKATGRRDCDKCGIDDELKFDRGYCPSNVAAWDI